ncbi:hypothetical protein NQX30_04825 [Candidatus Persebacteraceae bacterium Df01]|jgi:phage baseplate assembly protein V|uniref:Phage baseplate assembly protein V n=1 Tax=Candidatus Doriopsillibacter californiensis TaxID=2970740 RepID=A0ABT7QLW5_9GAMM|nr:hypothetical protein [Candidatus Persebacteraceae bacterium Df01]
MNNSDTIKMLHRRLVAVEKRVVRMITPGVVAQVQAEPYAVKANLAPHGEPEQLTDWLPVSQHRTASDMRTFMPVGVGTHGLLIAANGEMNAGFFVAGFCGATTPPAVDIEKRTHVAKIEMDGVYMTINKNENTIDITAVKGVTITGPLRVNGKITAADDVEILDGVTLKTHKHPQNNGNDFGGGAITGVAQ